MTRKTKKLIYRLKTIFLIIFGVIFLIFVMYIALILDSDIKYHPFSYNLNKIVIPKAEITKAESAHILLIGDRMGVALGHYLPYINKLLSKDLKEPLRVYNWSKKNEGIARTLNKLKMLSKVPSVVIFHGATDEFYEKYFDIADSQKIKNNIKKYNNPYFSTLLTLAPQLSKFLYTSTKDVIINTIEPDRTVYSDKEQQVRAEILYHQFHYNLEMLIKLVRKQNSNLILLTTPLNLTLPPKSTCSFATSENLLNHLEKIRGYLKRGKSKIAYEQLKLLSKHATANADVFFLLGKAAYKNDKIIEASKAFNLATAYECSPWRSNAVFNSIISKSAISNRIHLIDFNTHVNKSFERRVLFSDVFYPQPIFYEEISNKLINLVKSIMKIK